MSMGESNERQSPWGHGGHRRDLSGLSDKVQQRWMGHAEPS